MLLSLILEGRGRSDWAEKLGVSQKGHQGGWWQAEHVLVGSNGNGLWCSLVTRLDQGTG